MACPVTLLIDGGELNGKSRPNSWSLPATAGRHDESGWHVWISGPQYLIELDVARARQFAADVLAVCDVIDGVHSAVAVLDSAP